MNRLSNFLKFSAVFLFTVFVFASLSTAAVFPVPGLEWRWNSTLAEPTYIQVMMSPESADLDGDGIPEVIFISYQHRAWQADGILRALHGADGTEYFNVLDPALRAAPGSDLAVGDIDNDGLPEILAIKQTGEVMCFDNDGTWKWTSKVIVGIRKAVAIADIDNDGVPEVIAGRTVLNNDGSMRWVGTAGSGYDSVVADLDLDGVPEIVSSNAAYRNDGTIYWSAVMGTRHAVANFNKDPFPEVVGVGSQGVYMVAHDGTPIWGPIALPSAAGGIGPPLVADFDGDGLLDIGVAGYDLYTVFNQDGTYKWKAQIHDLSSGGAGATAFDFDGDGASEIVYSDEQFLRIFSGVDGSVLFQTEGPSATLLEQPIVLDVDNDGFAEIVTALNNSDRPNLNTGIEVYGTIQRWPPSRTIWNQYTYHVTNINDNATIPIAEKNNWGVFNDFRAQTYQGIDPVPDLKANGSDVPVTVTAGNLVSVDGGMIPSIYFGDNADWWVWADSIFGSYWYTLSSGWVPSVTPVITYAGPLVPLATRNIFSSSTLPVGAYAVHFDLDMNMNGVMDFPMFSDSVLIDVTP